MGTAPLESRLSRRISLAKYEVIEELGHGGMATVYRARDKRLDRDVAIKVLHPHLRDSGEVVQRFAVEARAVARLRHRNIVEVYDVSSEEDGEQFLVVELVEGQTLRKLLSQAGSMPPEVACGVVLELIAALEHAHESGVVHRDVKPENVLIEHRPTPSAGSRASASAPDGDDRVRVKLTDFGIAKMLDAQGVTSTGQVLGSPAHMAPEQIEGGEVDVRADVFGLGVLFYECVVGHLPFEGNNPAQVLRRVLDGSYSQADREEPRVGRRWAAIIARALAREREDRYESVTAMRRAIEAELEIARVASPREELAAFVDDPAVERTSIEARLVDTLCARGGEARRAGRALDAAAHYNRALALRPDDPALLRIVATMHRAEQRQRALRRIGVPGLAVLLLGAGAYWAVRVGRAHRVDAPPQDIGERAGPTAQDVSSEPRAVADAAVMVSPKAVQVTHIAPRAPVSARKATTRRVVFATVRPPQGVSVSVDGESAVEVTAGGEIVLDERSHQLSFRCAKNACEPRSRSVEAGSEDARIDVEMRIRDAEVLVDGRAESTYGLEQYPSLVLRAGAPVNVPMNRGSYPVVVVERDSGRRTTVILRPGERVTATFTRL